MPAYHLINIKWPKRACPSDTGCVCAASDFGFKCEMQQCPDTTIRIASATEYMELQRQTKQVK